MHFLAPFGSFYGIPRQNAQQIEAKCIYPHCSVEKLARQQYRSGKNLAEHNRTVTKLWQKMHFLAPFGHLYGVFRPNGQQIEAKCIYPHCSVEKLARQQYRSGKNLAEYNRTVTKLWQKMHFLAPFGRFYGVFRPNAHQIMAKNAFPRTVRPPLWCFSPERSPN